MKDQRVENWLTTEGVQWRYEPEVPLSRINVRMTKENQSRLDSALNEDVVVEYAIAMMDGVEFPALVGYEDREQDVLITGRHRLAAALEAKKTSFDMYIVESTDQYVLDRLTRSANIIEGMRPSREELIQHGMHLVRTYNRSIKEVAATLKIPIGSLQRAISAQEAQQRMNAAGINAEGMSRSVVERIAQIKHLPAFKATAALVTEAALGQEDTWELVKQVNAQESEDEQLSIVAEWHDRPDIRDRVAQTRRGQTRSRGDKRTTVFRTITGLANVLESERSLSALHFTSQADRDKLWQEFQRVYARMEALFAGTQVLTPPKPSKNGSRTARGRGVASRR